MKQTEMPHSKSHAVFVIGPIFNRDLRHYIDEVAYGKHKKTAHVEIISLNTNGIVNPLTERKIRPRRELVQAVQEES